MEKQAKKHIFIHYILHVINSARFIVLYSYLIDDDSEDKKAKGTTKCVVKRKLRFEICKSRLEVIQLKNKISHLEKNET